MVDKRLERCSAHLSPGEVTSQAPWFTLHIHKDDQGKKAAR